MGANTTSIAAGILTAAAVCVLNAGHVGLHQPGRPSAISILGSLVLLTGIALAPTIRPLTFAAAFGGAFVFLALALSIAAGSGNLVGLVILVSAILAFVGVTLGGVAAGIAVAIRRFDPPFWVAHATAAAGLLMLLAIGAGRLAERSAEPVRLKARIEEIRRAELAYANSNPAHAFTCNGPDLALSGFDWSADAQLGLQEKKRAHIEGHWVYLQCAPSARPRSMSIWAFGPGGDSFEVHLEL